MLSQLWHSSSRHLWIHTFEKLPGYKRVQWEIVYGWIDAIRLLGFLRCEEHLVLVEHVLLQIGCSVVRYYVFHKECIVHIPWLHWSRCSLLYEPWCVPRHRSKIMCKHDSRYQYFPKHCTCQLNLLDGLHDFVLDHGSLDLLWCFLSQVRLGYSSTWRNEKEDGQYSSSQASDWENYQEKVLRCWRKRRRRQVHHLLLRVWGNWRNRRTCLLC